MPAKQKKNSLAARLGEKARRVFEQKKTASPEFDSQAGLPAGIEGGIARLVECKFTQIAAGKQNAGKDMFYAAGIVVSPTEVNGVNLVGLRTQISEPLYETPTRSRKTVDEHLEWVMNEMKKLGIDMTELSIDDLEDVAEMLKEQQPYFRFRTWAGAKQEIVQRGGKFFVGTRGPYLTEAAAKTANPYAGREPTVQHNWNGACEFVEDEESADAVVDSTSKARSSKTKSKPSKPSPASEGEEDVYAIAKLADDGDQDAMAKLMEIASELGIEDATVDEAESWEAVADMLSSPADEAEEADEDEADEAEEADEEEEVEEEEWKPAKGEVYAYRAPGKRKAVDCEVTAVFEGKRTVSLKNLDDEKTYRAVPWDKLDS